MRYIGGKSLLVENIYKIIRENTENVQTITDIFSGSGIVGQFLKKQGFSVLSNDFLYVSRLCKNRNIQIDKNTVQTIQKQIFKQ